jgi:hypothetical protein
MAALLLPVFSFKFLIAALIIAEYVGCDAIVFVVFFVIDAFFIVVFFGLFAGDLAIVGIVAGAVVVVVAVIFALVCLI